MTKHLRLVAFLIILLLPTILYSSPRPQSASDVNVSGSITPDKVKKGSTVRGSVVIDVPPGLHVQSNRPLDKFLVGTKLDLETPAEMSAGPVTYPRPLMRNLKFSKRAVAVFEGRAVLRFTVTVPANYSYSSGEIRGKLRYQACDDESCFPPVTREVKMQLKVE
jgi:thioredoxin:protein disulfide reductase